MATLKGSQLCIYQWLVSLKPLLVSFTGRLYQVEYAMEAIGHAGTCLGILANDGVLLAAERRNIHKLLDEVFFSEKIYKLNEWVQPASAQLCSHASLQDGLFFFLQSGKMTVFLPQ